MNRRFRNVLDEKLSDLRAGRAPSLSPYEAGTTDGDELAALLGVAAALQTVPGPQPSAAGMMRGRQRLLAVMAETESRRSSGLAALWQSLRPVFAGAMATAILIVSVFALNTLGERSLPGSAFYPVKMLKEQVQVQLADTPREQAAVHLKMTKRRLNDLQNVTLRDGTPNLDVLAAMTREMDAAIAALAQVPATQTGPLLSDLAAAARRQQSSLLWVQRQSPPEYQPVLAQALVRAHETYQIALAAPTDGLTADRPLSGLAVAAIVEFKGPVMADEPDVLTVGSNQVALSKWTQSDARPELGSTVEVRAARLEDGRLVALNVQQMTPPVEGLWVRVNGAITGAYDSTWLINDRPVVFNAATNLVGWLQPGSTVEVSGLLRGDGTVLARDVQVKTSQAEVNVTGPIAARSADQWVVAGMPVRVSATTCMDESQALAENSQGATVHAVVQNDGSLVARSITTMVEEPAAAVTLKGTVTARDGDTWIVGGWTVVADAQTSVAASDNPVGRIAEIAAERLPDGTMRASSIAVEADAPAQSVRIAFQGTAAWVDGSVQIAGHPVQMDDSTDIRAQDRRLASLQPAAGRAMAVEGWLLPAGKVVAETVRVLRGTVSEVQGTIRELADGRITLDDKTIYVDDCVEVAAPGGSVSLADLQVGMLVIVTVEQSDSGALLAWKVRVAGLPSDKGSTPKPTNEPVPSGDTPTPAAPTETPAPPAPTETPTPGHTPPGQAKPKKGPGTPVPVTPTPEPTATPDTTATPEPTATPWPTIVVKPKGHDPKPLPLPPTATPEPTATVEPTSTPEPTATPAPDETPMPGPGGPGGPGAPPVPTIEPTPVPGPGGPGAPGAPIPVPPLAPIVPKAIPTLEPPGKPMPVPIS